jgi:hypothetical protein
MMVHIVLLLILFAVFATLWLESFWSNALTLMNVVLATLLAVSFFEPAADLIEGQLSAYSYTYLIDYLCLWFLFAIFFAIFRAGTDFLSRARVKFKMPVEYAGRVISALLVGYVMVSFTALSFHVAPLAAVPWGGSFAETPDSATFLFLQPDQSYLGFAKQASRGSLAGAEFDPAGTFLRDYRQRRKNLETIEGLRVPE